MINAVLFSIFIMNPTGSIDGGSEKQIYIEPGFATAKTYSSKDECDYALGIVAGKQHDALLVMEQAGLGGQKTLSMRKRIESMQCLPADTAEPDDPEVTTAATATKKTKTELVDVWRIGRFAGDVFHGTKDDPSTYLEKSTCMRALNRVRLRVLDEARRNGEESAFETLERFNNRYDCHTVVIEASELPSVGKKTELAEIRPIREETQAEAGEQVRYEPEVTYPMPGFTDSRSVNRRAFQMAEYSRGANPGWVRYESAYATVAQCWGAVREKITNEETNILGMYQKMTPSRQSVEWYQGALDQLKQRKQKLTCLVVK
jgi:hypothetical protein